MQQAFILNSRTMQQTKVDQELEDATNKYCENVEDLGDGDGVHSITQVGDAFLTGANWEKERSFSLQQVLEAIRYGFTYYRTAQHDGVDVPLGNKLQWLLGQYPPEQWPELKERWEKEFKS